MPRLMVQFARMVTPSRPWAFRAAVYCLVLVVGTAFVGRLAGQQETTLQLAGNIRGTVRDTSGAVVAGAVVNLEADGLRGQRTAITDEAGQFQFSLVNARAYNITIMASGFEVWTAKDVASSVENPPVISAVLRVASTSTQVNVTLPPHELAVEQVKAEEKQRVVGVLPNFFVTYEPNAAPLTAKQKFQLGWKTFFDPVPIVFSAAGAGIQQTRNSYPTYGQGMEGYAKRFGANYADRVDHILIGHVLMQSVFHQDPRYFYKGTGTFGSRALYAVERAFIAKGDNGRWQPAYADVLGGVASYGISTLYRPGTSRPGLRLEHAVLLGFANRAAHNLFEEFVLRRVTTHLPKTAISQPVLRAGTPVTLISMGELSTMTSENRGAIGFTLASDLQVARAVVAKAGSQARGEVKYTPGRGTTGVNVDLERVRLTVGNVEVPLRSTQVRDGGGRVAYHRLENSGRIVIVLYVDKDVILAPPL